mmetsp:Transcript_68802/g.192936  ORF Transcript_68802/g.192936 Transcript_68802/m.192936 type:complete len:474 (+) Transcript_68802:458-1879(+)
MPLLIAISAVEVCALDAMKQSNALLALGAVAHLDPCPPMILPAPLGVQPVEAHLAEEVLALVAEQHGVLLVALDTDLHLLHTLGLLLAHLLELPNDVAVALHQIPEVAHIGDPALLLDRIGVVAQRALEHVHQVRLVLDVDPEDALHLQNILHCLDQRVLGPVLDVLHDLEGEDARQQVLNSEGHDRLPVSHRLLQPGGLEHLAVLLVVRVLPCRLVRRGVHPIDPAFADILEEVRGLGLAPEGLADPEVVLVRRWVEAQVPHVLLQVWGLPVRAVQDPINDGLVVRALLQGDLHLVPRDAKGAPRSLVEDPQVAILVTLHDLQELVPDLGDVGVPLEHREILRDRALRQVHDLKFRAKALRAFAGHEHDLVVIPLDDDFVSDRDVVLALDLVLRGVALTVELRAEVHDQERSVIGDDEVALLPTSEVLQALCLADDALLVRMASSEHFGLSLVIGHGCNPPQDKPAFRRKGA